MSQAVLPAVLQDLIHEHKLFQRPEWLRLTELERELINTLSRTDMTAGEKKRKYASLTYPFRAIRENVLLNGTRLRTKKENVHNSSTEKPNIPLQIGVSKGRSEAGNSTDEENETFDKGSNGGESFQEANDTFTEDMELNDSHDIGATGSDVRAVKARVIDVLTNSNFLQDKSLPEREEIIKESVNDLLDAINYERNRKASADDRLENVRQAESALKLLNPQLFNYITTKEGFTSMPEKTHQGVVAEKKYGTARLKKQGFALDTAGMDNLLHTPRGIDSEMLENVEAFAHTLVKPKNLTVEGDKRRKTEKVTTLESSMGEKNDRSKIVKIPTITQKKVTHLSPISAINAPRTSARQQANPNPFQEDVFKALK